MLPRLRRQAVWNSRKRSRITSVSSAISVSDGPSRVSTPTKIDETPARDPQRSLQWSNQRPGKPAGHADYTTAPARLRRARRSSTELRRASKFDRIHPSRRFPSSPSSRSFTRTDTNGLLSCKGKISKMVIFTRLANPVSSVAGVSLSQISYRMLSSRPGLSLVAVLAPPWSPRNGCRVSRPRYLIQNSTPTPGATRASPPSDFGLTGYSVVGILTHRETCDAAQNKMMHPGLY